jgi:regulator of ribonuclease activity A
MRTSTTDLCDEYGDHVRVVVGPYRHFGGKRRFHGPVLTLRCPEDNSRLKELTTKDGGGRVLVVDGGGSLRRALLGDMVGKQLLDKGWAGIVVHGAVRDSEALAAMPFGVMALGTVPRRSNKNGEGQVGIPVEIGGVVCRPGDQLYADEDGIVLLDPSLLSDADRG